MSLDLNLLENQEIRRFEAGQRVMRDGSKSGILLVLIEGAFEVRKGDFVIDVVSEQGTVFGEISVLADVGHSADVTAVAPSSAYVIENPMAFMRAHPEFHLHVSTLLARRLNGMVTYLKDVKRQFEGHDHIGMVDEVLDSLVHKAPRDRRRTRPGIMRDAPIE